MRFVTFVFFLILIRLTSYSYDDHGFDFPEIFICAKLPRCQGHRRLKKSSFRCEYLRKIDAIFENYYDQRPCNQHGMLIRI